MTTLITNGTVLTQNADREVIDEGAVLLRGEKIAAVGTADELDGEYDADRIIDAEGGVVIPGLINAHVHVSDILLRGAFDADRGLYDWLYNVKRPSVIAMEPAEHAVAAELYCTESIRSGVTTFVEADTEVLWEDWSAIEAKLGVYDRAGIRNAYGAGFADVSPDDAFASLLADIQARDPTVDHAPVDRLTVDTDTALSETEALIEAHHGSADGRQSIWPSPIVLETTSRAGFQGAARLAEEYDVMTTAHMSEAEAQEQEVALSSIEYLRNAGYLGERTLLGHCVQVDAGDVRLLAATDTKVAHNFFANMRLATGFAPIVRMLENGVTVGLGTDNTSGVGGPQRISPRPGRLRRTDGRRYAHHRRRARHRSRGRPRLDRTGQTGRYRNRRYRQATSHARARPGVRTRCRGAGVGRRDGPLCG